MSLEALRLKAKKAVSALDVLADFGKALEQATAIEQLSNDAAKRLVDSEAQIKAASDTLEALMKAQEQAKLEATDIISGAKAEAAKIRAESKSKSEVAAQKAKEKHDAVLAAAAEAEAKFALDKQMREEVLAMLGAQIAHAEAKLAEIREAVSKLAKV